MRQFIHDRNLPALVRRHGPLLGALGCALVLSTVVYSIVHGQRQNRLAIEKGCVLLNNKIIEGQSAQAGSATTILIREILRNADEHGRGYVVVQYRKATGDTNGQLAVIDCQKVAKHPDQIHQLNP